MHGVPPALARAFERELEAFEVEDGEISRVEDFGAPRQKKLHQKTLRTNVPS